MATSRRGQGKPPTATTTVAGSPPPRAEKCKVTKYYHRVCRHGRRASRCAACGGHEMCKHGRRLRCCNVCGVIGRGLCGHGRDTYYCRDCNGNGICPHGRPRYVCVQCHGAGVCKHRRVKRNCSDCSPCTALAHSIRDHLRSGVKRMAVGEARSPAAAAAASSALQREQLPRLLGCSMGFFKRYLEAQWQGDMSWASYGRHGWHVDHRRPVASFNLARREDRRMCFHYSNLQPMWAADNLRKSARFDPATFTKRWNGVRWVARRGRCG